MKASTPSSRGMAPRPPSHPAQPPVRPSSRLSVPLIGLAAIVFAAFLPLAARADDNAEYSLALDAGAGWLLAAPDWPPTAAGSVALWQLDANFLHRLQAPRWSFTFNHSLDLSGNSGASAAQTIGGATAPINATMTISEAYARWDLADWAQLFVGKRRMALGLGTAFAPGDVVNPRNGFWDQKTGFRGLAFSASLGSDLGFRAALSLDRNFDAYLKAATAATAAAIPANPALSGLRAAAAAALDGADGPADPALAVYAFGADWQSGNIQLAVADVYAPGRYHRPSAGAGLEIAGLILQLEAAAELDGWPDDRTEPGWFFAVGGRYRFDWDDAGLVLSCDYDYNGESGLLRHTHYLLPTVSFTLTDRFAVSARAIIGLDEKSALATATLTLYPTEGFDLELAAAGGIGADGTEFAVLGAPISNLTGNLRGSLRFSARIHL